MSFSAVLFTNYFPSIFLRKKIYDIIHGIPIHASTAQRVTISKLEIVKVQAIQSMAIGSEIQPKILCAIFHVSSSHIVHGKCSSVCLLNGSFGDIIPAKIITLETSAIANSFSTFSEKVRRSKATKREKIIPTTKTRMLKRVVIRKMPSLKSAVVMLVSRAKLRYRIITATRRHIPTSRIETISFFTIKAMSMAANERNKLRPFLCGKHIIIIRRDHF